jgi:hypothetical protein
MLEPNSSVLFFSFALALPCLIPLQDYGLGKEGMIFPFVKYLDVKFYNLDLKIALFTWGLYLGSSVLARFQGQPLYKLRLFLLNMAFFHIETDGLCSLSVCLILMAFRKFLLKMSKRASCY